VFTNIMVIIGFKQYEAFGILDNPARYAGLLGHKIKEQKA